MVGVGELSKKSSASVPSGVGAVPNVRVQAVNPKAVLTDKVVSSEIADYVFTNAKVYTVNEEQPWAEAVAVQGNKIVYVGDNAGAAALVGEGTEQIDLKGRMVMPGFVDAHLHAIAGGMIAALLIGAVAGLYPAMRAARVSPTEALRTL